MIGIVPMVNCDEPAVAARGRAVACQVHMRELSTVDVIRRYPDPATDAPVGSVCGQHLRQPEGFEDIGERIDVVMDALHAASVSRLTPAGLRTLRARAAEVTTLLQALIGAAEVDQAAAATDVDDGYEKFLADVAPGGER